MSLPHRETIVLGYICAVADPEPGAGEVLVRVAGAGACHSNLHVMNEFDPGMLPYKLPFTLGHETAGGIEALGDGVEEGIEIGTPVAVYGPWGCGRCSNCRTVSRLLGDITRRARRQTLGVSFFSVPQQAAVATIYLARRRRARRGRGTGTTRTARVHVERFALDDVIDAYGKPERGEIDRHAVIVPN